ncbi:MAG TPA: hypothetical protein VLE73_05210 [Candidatus Saccharimonadales bacterium]|nr:hypothetical protein [Candidatus Saccharimonadales bacterium]
MRIVLFDLDHTLFAADDVLHAGANELLPILRRLDMTLIGLSSRDHKVIVRLEDAGIRHFFSEVLCSDQHRTPKESSGVYHVLSKVGGAPHHAVLVSHAHADILLGKDVGVRKTIGVSHSAEHKNAHPLLDAGADHVVADLPSVLDVVE